MNSKIITIFFTIVLGFAFSASGQIVRIDFSATVDAVTGQPPNGIAPGSIVNGHVSVDLQYHPIRCDTGALHSACWDYTDRTPGYIFEFDTGSQTLTWNSVMAANGPGTVPGIFLTDIVELMQIISIEARNAGETASVLLRFADTNTPLSLLTGMRFPEDIHLEESTEASLYYYGDIVGGEMNFFHARVTAVSIKTIPPRATCESLAVMVNGAKISSQSRKALLTILENACNSLARGNCSAGAAQVQAFQNRVRAQVLKENATLAEQLNNAVKEMIEDACAEK